MRLSPSNHARVFLRKSKWKILTTLCVTYALQNVPLVLMEDLLMQICCITWRALKRQSSIPQLKPQGLKMKVVGFIENGAPSGIGAVAVNSNYGKVWVDPRCFFVGRKTPIFRKEILQAVEEAPYGRSYITSGVASTCYDLTRLEEA